MILRLFLRDPALRSMPRWLATGLVLASLLAGVRAAILAYNASRSLPPPEAGNLILLVLGLWTPAAIYLLFGRTGQRCSRFDLVLPLPAPRLWLAHHAAVLLSLTAILAGSYGIIALHDRLLARLTDGEWTAPLGPQVLVLPAVAALFLAMFILQGRRPSVYRVPTGRSELPVVGASLLGALILIFVLGRLPAAAAVAPLVLAGLLAVRAYRAAPSAYMLVPAEAEEAKYGAGTDVRSWDAAQATGGASGRWRLQGRILRILALGIAPGQLLKIPASLFVLPFLLIWGAFLSSGVMRGEILTAYLLFAGLAAPMAQLHLLDPLPVARRLICVYLLVPGLILTSLGYGLGRLFDMQRETPVPIRLHAGYDRELIPPHRMEGAVLRVPPQYCRIAWDGEPPAIHSPWGETREPWTSGIYKDSRARLYSPFSTPEGSSVEFVALQISRAAEAVYGVSIPPAEIREQYLDVVDGAVVPKGTGEIDLTAIRSDLRPRRARSVFPIVITVVTLIFFLLSAIYFRAFRANLTDGRRKAVFFTLLGVTLVAHIAPFVLFMTGWSASWAVTTVVDALLVSTADHLPGGEAAIWLLCALAIAVGYRLTQSQFERIEVPIPREQPEI